MTSRHTDSDGRSASRPPAPTPFEVRVEHRDGLVRVAPVGELDVRTAAELRDALEDVVAPQSSRLVLDLRDLSFIDSSGLHLLVDVCRSPPRADLVVALIQGPEAVRRVFELTGMLDTLPFVPPSGG